MRIGGRRCGGSSSLGSREDGHGELQASLDPTKRRGIEMSLDDRADIDESYSLAFDKQHLYS
jgi:hypothetical protein